MIEDIIIKSLSNQGISSSEKNQLTDWLKSNRKNRMVYAQMKLSLANVDTNTVSNIKEEVWKDLESRDYGTVVRRNWRDSKLWYKVAAVVFLCSSLSLIALKFMDSSKDASLAVVEKKVIEKVCLPGQKITTQLSDGTVIKLNADSKILIPEFFENNTRQVELVGEAFFDVARDESKPFTIKTKDFQVTVLGTSFNIKVYEEGKSKTVQVKSGKVLVKNNKGEAITLLPNEMISIGVDGSLEKYSIEDPSTAFGWLDQQMVFKDHEFDQVISTLSRWYGLDIKIEKEITSIKRYTAHYDNPSFKEVLESISHVYEFDYEIEGNKVMIK